MPYKYISYKDLAENGQTGFYVMEIRHNFFYL